MTDEQKAASTEDVFMEEYDEESLIEGRTQAVEFVGQLEKEWLRMAEQYRNLGQEAEAGTYEECAEELESKIEQFANTK